MFFRSKFTHTKPILSAMYKKKHIKTHGLMNHYIIMIKNNIFNHNLTKKKTNKIFPLYLFLL